MLPVAVLPLFNLRLLRLSLVSIVFLILLGCSQLGDYNSAIGNLEASGSIGANVNLQGNVVDRAPFLTGGAYQLEDRTGKIWITTSSKLPAIGEEVSLEGKVQYQNISVDNLEWGEVYINAL
jgi:hypothetical protein